MQNEVNIQIFLSSVYYGSANAVKFFRILDSQTGKESRTETAELRFLGAVSEHYTRKELETPVSKTLIESNLTRSNENYQITKL